MRLSIAATVFFTVTSFVPVASVKLGSPKAEETVPEPVSFGIHLKKGQSAVPKSLTLTRGSNRRKLLFNFFNKLDNPAERQFFYFQDDDETAAWFENGKVVEYTAADEDDYTGVCGEKNCFRQVTAIVEIEKGDKLELEVHVGSDSEDDWEFSCPDPIMKMSLVESDCFCFETGGTCDFGILDADGFTYEIGVEETASSCTDGVKGSFKIRCGP